VKTGVFRRVAIAGVGLSRMRPPENQSSAHVGGTHWASALGLEQRILVDRRAWNALLEGPRFGNEFG
jgi:hypothetical protein